MNFVVQNATNEDAQDIVDFWNLVADETDNFTFGKDEFPIQDAAHMIDHLEQQARKGGFTMIARLQRSKKNGGPRLVGVLSVDVGDRPRTRHRAELQVAVARDYWRQGIGRRIIEYSIGTIEGDQAIEVLSCRVRSDNTKAIRLYEQFGLEKTGVDRGILKVGDTLVDATVMSRVLHRATAKPGQPLFYLEDVLEAIEGASEHTRYYACLETGAIDCWMDECMFGTIAEDGFDPETAEGKWAPLPDRYDVDDWGTMRDFANLQDDGLRNRLMDIIHRRGAYGRFKDECARRGLLQEYYAFKDTHYRDVAIEWLERNHCIWTEGSSRRA